MEYKELREHDRAEQQRISSRIKRGTIKLYYAVYIRGELVRYVEAKDIKKFTKFEKYKAYSLQEMVEYKKMAKVGRPKKANATKRVRKTISVEKLFGVITQIEETNKPNEDYVTRLNVLSRLRKEIKNELGE